MSDYRPGNHGTGSALAAALIGILTVVGVVANLAGIAQLKDAPVPVIATVLSIAVIILALHAISAHRDQQRGIAVWLASGAIVCALGALAAISLPPLKERISTLPNKPVISDTNTVQPTKNSSPPIHSSERSSPALAPTLYEGQLQIRPNQGVDLDADHPQPINASAATGDTDIALMFYGNLQATHQGFYTLSSSSDQSQLTCRQATASTPAHKEVPSISGNQYCFMTSAGHLAWVEVVDSTTTDIPINNPHVVLSFRVWD